MRHKRLMWLLAAVLVLSLLAACGRGNDKTSDPAPAGKQTNSSQSGDKGSESAGSGKEVTLQFALWDTNQAKGLRTMADEFEAANPGIKIEFQVVGWADYWTMLQAGATAQSLPDVFWMHSNEIYRYASNDMLLDQTELIKNSSKIDLSKYPQGIVEIYNYEGKQLAVPKDFDTIGLWYNKKLFDEANLAYPDESWTWDDLYNAAKVLTKDGVYGFLAPLHNQEGYYNFVYQNGGTIITDDKKSGYDDPKTIEALEFYVKFVQEKLSPEMYGDPERAEALQNGLVAMGLFGSWNLSGFAENEFISENFDVAVLPKQEKQASIYNGLGYAIAKNTEHPDEAWKFVEYLGSKEGQDRQAELGIAISAYEGSADLWLTSNKTFNIKAFVDMVKYGVIRPYSNTTAQWEDKAYEALVPAFRGVSTMEEAAKNAAKVMNDILATEK